MLKNSPNISDAFNGFSKLSYPERLDKLVELGALSAKDMVYLKSGGLNDIHLAEKFIENVIGYFQLPLGVCTNFRIDGEDKVIPMAVEETSIIAAASKTAKWVRENGYIETSTLGRNIIGQVQIPRVENLDKLQGLLRENKLKWIQELNEKVAWNMVLRGGGVNDMELRVLSRPDGGWMAVVHIHMDPVDAMGANIVNQVCEYFKVPLQEASGEKVGMCILSNLVDTRLTQAKVVLEKIDLDLAQKIEEASLFAQLDPYRAATNNKGVLNGIDPILIATGNDWRAVEAGVHAFAAQGDHYASITKWKLEGKNLVGTLTAPLVVGTVGGVTNLHPTAALSLRMLNVASAAELGRILAAVGLVQNLGALRALTTVGIIEGHMKLHIRNLTLGAGASEAETPVVVRRLEEILVKDKRVSMSHAVAVLKEIRMPAPGVSGIENLV